MGKLVDIKQRTPEWHEWRRGKISASMISTIMGLNPYQTPLQLYEQILSGKETPVTVPMLKGIALEPEAREWLEKEKDCLYPEACFEHKLHPHFVASLDGYNPNAPISIVEIKVLGSDAHQLAMSGIVPAWYYPQCQWQMYVVDAEVMYYFSFGASGNATIEVKRDDKFIAKAITAANEFYRCLNDFIPPDPTDQDLIPINDSRALLLSAELADMQITKKSMVNREEKIREELKMICKDKSSLIGNRFRFIKYARKGAVDYAAIPELKGVDTEKYRKKPIETWRFT